MRVSTSTLVAIFASPFLVLAQSNPFNIPSAGLSATAGSSITLNWNPTTSGTVSLILRSGASSNLAAGTYIATNIANSGSYTWSVPSGITRGSDYSVEIVDDADTSQTNYTPYFVIDSTNTVATSTADISLGAPASSIAQSTASPTSTATGSGSSTAVVATTTASSASASGSTVIGTTVTTSGSSASSGSSTLSTGTKSGSSSSSGSSSAGGSSSTGSSSGSSTTGAGFQSSAAASASATGSSNAAGARVTAAAGLMGFVALGAFAL